MFSLRALVPLFLAWSTASAQTCAPQWLAGDHVPYTSGSVEAVVTWDPDGVGPQPQMLVAGGRFTAGPLTDVAIAAYDGTQWLPLGTPSGSSVTAMTVWNGQLIAATVTGTFSSALSTWNGTGWAPLGSFGSVAGRVHALATFNSSLVAGGSFSSVDGSPAANIAQWNGSGWSALGSGIAGQVYALQWFGAALHVGGNFTTAGGLPVSHHALWNGSTWFAGAAFNGQIDSFGYRSSIATTQTYLFAGGTFTAIGSLSTPHVARLTQSTGLWTAMGTGIPCTTVTDLFVRYVGISGFELSAAVEGTSDEVWRWSGTAWNPLGTLQDQTTGAAPRALGYFGGYVLGLANATWAMRKYDGTQVWGPLLGLGIDERVSASCSAGADLVIGGSFRTISGVTMNGIARGGPGAWQPLGSGLEGGFGAFALVTMPNGDVVAAGSFTTAGGVAASHIARWDGASWSQFGGGMNDIVYALALMPNGDLVAAGRFTLAGSVACNRIARWNGVTWSPLGTGSPSQINALHVAPNGDLLVGGNFTTIGGISASRIARWNGSSWSALGSGLNNAVWTVATTPAGDVVAGGAFTAAGAVSTPYIARWNGVAWSSLASFAYHPESDVFSVAVLPDGDIVACGAEWSFSIPLPIGLTISGNVARFDQANGSWTSLDVHGSFVQHVRVLPQGGLVVGGMFDRAGGQSIANFGWLVPPCPALASTTGGGCNGETLVATSLPWANGVFRGLGTGLPVNSFVIAVTGFNAIVPGLPLTFVFAEALPGCDLHTTADLFEGIVATNGTATSMLLLPNSPPLVGLVLQHQMVPIEFGPSGIATVTATNALQLTCGIL